MTVTMTPIYVLVYIMLFGFIIGKSVFYYCNYQEKKHVQAREEAIRTYVDTGKKTATFHTLRRGAVKAAERQRFRRIADNARSNTNFSAWTPCPQCGALDVHYINLLRFGNIQRECCVCSFNWRQK